MVRRTTLNEVGITSNEINFVEKLVHLVAKESNVIKIISEKAFEGTLGPTRWGHKVWKAPPDASLRDGMTVKLASFIKTHQ